MDQYLRQAFLSAIYISKPSNKNQVHNIELPIDSGQFFSEYIKQACPPEIHLDIHKSTYKKLTHFYDAMEK
jgi:hypothetical protein